MKLKNIGREIILMVIAAGFGSGMTYWLSNSAFNAQIVELKEKIAELEVKERNAIVTKRISEQMEDIAYQQQLVSDEQRMRAEEQSRIADMERGKAEIERATARQAERQAVYSARQADSMRVVAEAESERATHHMLEAQASQAKADTLFYNSLGRTLAHSSLQQKNAGNSSLASLMSYSAWFYTKTYGGNQYQQDVFHALVETSGADRPEKLALKGNIRSIAMPDGGKEMSHYLAVSDYGEIVLLSRNSKVKGEDLEPVVLYQNKAYDFRCVIMTGKESGVSLDVNGAVLPVEGSSKMKSNAPVIKLPDDHWMALQRTSDSMLVAIGQHHAVALSPDGKTILKTTKIQNTVTAHGIARDGSVLLFCMDGQALRYGDNMEMVATYPFAAKDRITAFVHQSRSGYDVLGTESGALYVCKPDGTVVTTLVGHTGRITQLQEYSRMVMSSSYDYSVKMWDLGNVGSLITSNEMIYDNWPLCFVYDSAYATLHIGFSEGTVRNLCISAKANAGNTQNTLTREFTQEEWNYYIGKDVPYRTFMK